MSISRLMRSRGSFSPKTVNINAGKGNENGSFSCQPFSDLFLFIVCLGLILLNVSVCVTMKTLLSLTVFYDFCRNFHAFYVKDFTVG